MLEDFEKTGRMVLHPPSDQVPYLTRLKKNEVPLEEAASQAMLWNQDIVECANRIIKASDVTDEVSSKMMDATRNAVYFAVRSEASGIQKVMDVSEVKHE